MNRGTGPRTRPVKKQPTFSKLRHSKLRHAIPMSFVAAPRLSRWAKTCAFPNSKL